MHTYLAKGHPDGNWGSALEFLKVPQFSKKSALFRSGPPSSEFLFLPLQHSVESSRYQLLRLSAFKRERERKGAHTQPAF